MLEELAAEVTGGANDNQPFGEVAEGSARNGRPPAVTARLLRLAQESGATYFRDSASGQYYVAPNGDGTQVRRLDSRDAARWLARLWMEAEGSPVTPDSVKSTVFSLSALVNDADTRALGVRVASRNGVLWYDLGDAAVSISAEGWTVEERPPIIFKRFPHQLPQVRPASPGDFSRINLYLPVAPDSDESLLLRVWLLACISPDGPRPVLDLAGPQG